MIKVNVMYPYTEGARFDHAYYRDRHMPMVKSRLGSLLRGLSICNMLQPIQSAL
jgi:uncharacterized protein (TIGR02118 family)